MLNGEVNLTCTTVTPQCDQYVAKVINYWHPNHGLLLVNDLHTIILLLLFLKNLICFLYISWSAGEEMYL